MLPGQKNLALVQKQLNSTVIKKAFKKLFKIKIFLIKKYNFWWKEDSYLIKTILIFTPQICYIYTKKIQAFFFLY